MNMGAIKPFFIVGCGRSGTTLLRSLLNNHPEIAIPLESLFLVDYLKVSKEFEFNYLKRMFLHEPELRDWGIEIQSEEVDGCTNIEDLIFRVHELYANSHGKSRWGQKTPRFVRFMDLILEHFPASRFVHLVRDPRAVANSLIHSNVHRSNPYHAAKRWSMDIHFGLDFEQRFPGILHRMSYESLVANPEDALQQLTDFLEIPYSETMLSEVRSSASEYTRFYEQIHSNIDLAPSSTFINRWRSELPPDEIQLIEALSGNQMEELGYQRIYPEESLSEINTRRSLIQRSFGLVRQSWQYLRYRRRYLIHLLWRKQRLGLLGEFLPAIHY